jgi:hypothetical protein
MNLLNLLLPITFNLLTIAQPDTNFKSIHQLQYEEHSSETLGIIGKNGEKNLLKEKTTEKTIINFSLMVIIILLFIITISILFILRKNLRIKR